MLLSQMDHLYLSEYCDILEATNYKVSAEDLKELTDRLLNNPSLRAIWHNKNETLRELAYQLVDRNYKAEIYTDGEDDDDPILYIYLSFKGLYFGINYKKELVLTKEEWYGGGGNNKEEYEIIIGTPSVENIINTIDIFNRDGRRGFSNKDVSMRKLLNGKSDIQL